MKCTSGINRETLTQAAEELLFFDTRNARAKEKNLQELVNTNQCGDWLPYTTVCETWDEYRLCFDTVEEMIVDMMRYRSHCFAMHIHTMHEPQNTCTPKVICSLVIENMEFMQILGYLLDCMRDGSEIYDASFNDCEGERPCYRVHSRETQTVEPVFTALKIVIND